MAIATLDDLLAGLLQPEEVYKDAFTGEAAGGFHSSLYISGRPGAGVAPSPGLAGLALTSYAGQVPFPAAVANRNVYLAGIDFLAGSGIGTALLCDRLWHNSGIVVTTTTGQTINSVAWPARDANGSTNGVGVGVAIEVSTATTNGAAVTNTTMSYTNSDGTAGRTATIASFPATAVAGTFVPFSLQAGDYGVRSIQTITLGTSYGGGAIHLVAYRKPGPSIPKTTSNVAVRLGPAECGMPRWYDSSIPWLVYVITSTSVDTSLATVQWAQA